MAELADAQASGACCGLHSVGSSPISCTTYNVGKYVSAEVSELADEQD